MFFFIILGLAIAAIPTAVVWGYLQARAEHRHELSTPYGQRMRDAWAKAGVKWTGHTDPALPPPTQEQARDLVFMEGFHEDHTVEMAAQAACERASSMIVNLGYTVEGAREEAARIIAKDFASVHGYTASKRVRERVKGMPVHLLLNDRALRKLEEDSDRLQAAYSDGGLDAMTAVADDLGMGRDQAYDPLGWVERQQKVLRAEARDQGHNRTAYKKARQAAKDSDPWGAASQQVME